MDRWLLADADGHQPFPGKSLFHGTTGSDLCASEAKDPDAFGAHRTVKEVPESVILNPRLSVLILGSAIDLMGPLKISADSA